MVFSLGFSVTNRRYLGNKNKLLFPIENVLSLCEGDSFIDLFGGTGTVTAHLLEKGGFYKRFVINDLLFSNEVIYKAFFGEGAWDANKLNDYIEKNISSIEIDKIEENYFSKSYGDKYFKQSDALQIGFIRDILERDRLNFTEKEFNIMLASLIYSLDRCSQTTGHYEAFMGKKDDKKSFVFQLIEPLAIESGTKVEIYRKDANELVKDIEADIAFLDPPYNSRDYGQYYHVLEQIVKWDKPELFGKTAKPKGIVKSEYCSNSAAKTFEELIEDLKVKYILVTYNNSFSTSASSRNKISYEDMVRILSNKGELEIFENNYKAFNAGKTNIEGHKELIFFVKVK